MTDTFNPLSASGHSGQGYAQLHECPHTRPGVDQVLSQAATDGARQDTEAEEPSKAVCTSQHGDRSDFPWVGDIPGLRPKVPAPVFDSVGISLALCLNTAILNEAVSLSRRVFSTQVPVVGAQGQEQRTGRTTHMAFQM